jgi:hypothetical protein
MKPHCDGLGLTALGGAMTYERPEIRDFGDIAQHTFIDGGVDFCGNSAELCDESTVDG